MKTEDYEQLEMLLSKLSEEFGRGQVCILNGHVQAGYYIALYDSKGERDKELSGPSIQWCVNEFKGITPKTLLM